MITFAGGKNLRLLNCVLRIVLFLHCVFFMHTLYARDYYAHLTKTASENESAFVDSLISLPYDIMVADFQKASLWMNSALTVATKIKYEKGQAHLSAKLATVKYLQGDYDSAVYFNLQAITLFEKLQDEVEMGAVLCEAGYQMKRRDMNVAFEYFRRGLLLLEKNNATAKLTAAYDNFGVLFEMKNRLDSAFVYYNKALSLKVELLDSIGMPYSLNNLGLLKMMEKDFTSAKSYLDQAFAIRLSRRDLFGIAESKAYYGDLYMAWGNWKEAINWYLASNQDCASLKYPRQMQYNFEQLSFCYEKNLQYTESLEALRKSAQLKDELINEENSRAIIELEQKYYSAEKDNSISKLAAASVKRTLWIYIISSALLVFVIAAFWYNAHHRRKAEAIKNEAILAEREAGMKAVFEATEEERKRIARDLHDGIGQQLSGLKMSWESFGEAVELSNVQKEKLQRLNTILDEACGELRTISHQMMPRVLQESGLLSAIDDLLLKHASTTAIQCDFEHHAMSGFRCDQKIEISVYRICQELLNNVTKHSRASHITVQLYRNNNQLILIMEDNGLGMHEQSLNNGMGMLNIRSRLGTIGGSVQWAPGPECGTVVTVRVRLV